MHSHIHMNGSKLSCCQRKTYIAMRHYYSHPQLKLNRRQSISLCRPKTPYNAAAPLDDNALGEHEQRLVAPIKEKGVKPTVVCAGK